MEIRGGYAGQILEVDLSLGKIESKELEPELARNYIGGNGFGTYILWNHVTENIDPFDPGNILTIATGPLTGTFWPSSGRVEFTSKSPLSGIYGDANSGGFFGPELKYAGFDAIIIKGESPKPVFLNINNGRAELIDATSLWGLGTFETEQKIKDRFNDPEIAVACIGQAGENLVRFACVNITAARSAARSGMGAVMGSKKLKAISVRGKNSIRIFDPQGFYDACTKARNAVRNNEFTPGETRHGTPQLVSLMNAVGRFPTKNFQQGHTPHDDLINADRLEENHLVKHLACFACPIGCDKIYKVFTGEFAGASTSSLEYETLCSLGARCWNHNLPSIIKADWLCNDYGMDTISAGGVISFAMELFEKNILNLESTKGLDLTWGNYHSLLALIEKIAKRIDLGDILAQGSKRASEIISGDAPLYAMVVKGQEIPAQDGRSQQSMGLAHVTSSRGADHLKGFPTIDETGYASEAVKRYGEEYLPEIIDGIATKYKPMVVKDGEEFCAIVDSSSICKFGTLFPPALYWEEVLNGINSLTGFEITLEELKAAGERIVNLQRCYNILHGISSKDDTLPRRLLTEKSPSKRAKGHVVYLDKMLPDYYKLRGWNEKTGFPEKETLERLGISFAWERIKDKVKE